MFVPAWMMNPKYAVLADWAVAFGTLLASAVALWVAVVGSRREEWRRRKNDSILGAVIIASLLEEVRTGLGVMESNLTKITLRKQPSSGVLLLLPAASWEGMRTIPDNVLLRIVATARGIQPRAFPPTEIRTHCKNYFVHIKGNVGRWRTPIRMQQFLSSGPGNDDYIEATRKVITMLGQTMELLEKNARRWFPR